jgi:hypothetical protein
MDDRLTIAIGDIHGHADKLKALLWRCEGDGQAGNGH